MADTKQEKQNVLSFTPDIKFERKPIKGDGGTTLDDDASDRQSIRDVLAERDNRTRARRLANIKRIEDRLDTLEEKVIENLQDFKITFDPTTRPLVAAAVDTLMRERGAVPSIDIDDAEAADQAIDDLDEDVVRTFDEQVTPEGTITKTDAAPVVKEINITCYKRATTILMDSMYHAYGIDPISYGMANDGNGPPMVVPPKGKPANCREMEEMKQVDTSPDAELVPADAVLEQKQSSTLLDLFRIVWKLLLYFVYGWFIKLLTKLRMHKIPFGVGKKVKKYIKKLKKKRKKILCQITGDCTDENEDDPYVPNPYDGFEEMDTVGDNTWSGIECLSAAKTVLDFTATQLAFTPAVNIQNNVEDGGPGKDDRFGKVAGKAHLLPVLNAIAQTRDRFEAMKFATIMDIPSTETQFDKDIEEIEEKTKSRPRYGNRYQSRTAQGWKKTR